MPPRPPPSLAAPPAEKASKIEEFGQGFAFRFFLDGAPSASAAPPVLSAACTHGASAENPANSPAMVAAAAAEAAAAAL